jgi:capsular exopolysaccharide synthesis family protein
MIEALETEQPGVAPRQYLDVVRRRKWIILSVLTLTVGAAIAVSLLQEPVYQARTQIVVGQGGGLFQVNQPNAIQPFSATMKDLLKSNVIARRVIANLRLTGSEESLLSKVSVTVKPESSALNVAVQDHSRARARAIADEIGRVFSNLVNERFGQATPVAPDQQVPPLTTTVWDPAHIDPGQVSPRPKRNVAIAGVLGLILGLLAGFLRDHFDRALRTRESVEQAYGIPVIGQIPAATGRKRKERLLVNPFGESAEAYRALRANLQFLAVKRPLRTILITSASPEEGKTTVTANLAATIARSGASTIALDADLRRPRLDEAFGTRAKGPGLTSVLVGALDVEDAIQEVSLFQENGAGAARGGSQLAFLPSGPLPPNPSELLSSLQMATLLDHLAASYDYVLIDSPPVLLVADALELVRAVDGVVLIARRNRSTTEQARELRALVQRLDINLVGTVLSDAPATSSYYVDYADARESLEAETEQVGSR